MLKALLITGIEERLQGHWGPEYFISTHGALKVAPIDCTTDKVADHARISSDEFFRRFNDEVPCASRQKLKVRLMSDYIRQALHDLGLATRGGLPTEVRNSPQGVYDYHAY